MRSKAVNLSTFTLTIKCQIRAPKLRDKPEIKEKKQIHILKFNLYIINNSSYYKSKQNYLYHTEAK